MSFMFGLTKEQIRDRLKVQSKWITTSRTDFFSSVVTEHRTRYIVQIRLSGDNVAAQVANIERKEEDSSYSAKFTHVHVAQTGNVKLQDEEDLERPLLVLNGGSNLTGQLVTSGPSIAVSATYWDDEIR